MHLCGDIGDASSSSFVYCSSLMILTVGHGNDSMPPLFNCLFLLIPQTDKSPPSPAFSQACEDVPLDLSCKSTFSPAQVSSFPLPVGPFARSSLQGHTKEPFHQIKEPFHQIKEPFHQIKEAVEDIKQVSLNTGSLYSTPAYSGKALLPPPLLPIADVKTFLPSSFPRAAEGANPFEEADSQRSANSPQNLSVKGCPSSLISTPTETSLSSFSSWTSVAQVSPMNCFSDRGSSEDERENKLNELKELENKIFDLDHTKLFLAPDSSPMEAISDLPVFGKDSQAKKMKIVMADDSVTEQTVVMRTQQVS